MKSGKSIAIVGIGRWGKNLLREFNKVASIRYVYPGNNPENSKWLKKNYPRIQTAASYSQILHDSSVEAVVIATPINTHYKLAREALKAGKHVFVEKPITNNVKHAQELVKLAANKKRVLFVGHIFSYHPVLAKIKQLTQYAPLKYASFVWHKFGTFSEDIVSNLVSHDIATALDLFGQPTNLSTSQVDNRASANIISIHLDFKNNQSCVIYINRISNIKNKTVTLATNKNIYLWENDQLLKLDKKTNSFKLIYKNTKTPLEVECAEFIRCLEQNKKPRTSGEFGLKIVQILSKL